MKETFTETIRKNIGAIISVLGLFVLVVLTYGDMGELFTENYWKNVGGNISSIGSLTIGLSLVQYAIKQGMSEQALSKGLNTLETSNKYQEHRKLIGECSGKSIYLPYFLSIRNERETIHRRREFLIDNGYKNEKELLMSHNRKNIKTYKGIRINISVDSIKWSTTEIKYTKDGRIEKLDTYRRKRNVNGFISSCITMIGTAFITGGLFLDGNTIPIWQKTIKFFTYIITMALTSIFSISKNYEKGAFGVPNEITEINSIWQEFKDWEVPKDIVEEVEYGYEQSLFKRKEELKKEQDDGIKTIITTRNIQEKLKEVESA